jgi:two-component system, NtrC family, response regulator PilR
MDDFNFLHGAFDGKPEQDSGSISSLPEIYIVEDDQIFGRTLKKYLERKLKSTIIHFPSPADFISYLTSRQGDGEQNKPLPFCLITDITFENSSTDGLYMIDLLQEQGHSFVSIAMTGFASIETAITATKKGVFHYLTKPFELDFMFDLVIRAMTTKLNVPVTLLTKQSMGRKDTSHAVSISSGPKRGKKRGPAFRVEIPRPDDHFCGMIGRSDKMKEVFARIEKVAVSNSTVLIYGPSGTGKELVASSIHQLSSRKDNHMVSINCGAIPSELLESELFGHVKGAFTGAISSRKGRFEQADKASIFLDEIGDMPLLLQVKLLRVLQNRVIEPIGSGEAREVDVRIIAATHRNLEQQVQDGNFREDLFYRLNVIPIYLPSLAERQDDIPLLIGHFISRFMSADGRNSLEFDQEALELLVGYQWPGNVRELENLIERLIILRGGSIIRPSDLPAKFFQNQVDIHKYHTLVELPEDGINLKQTLSTIEDSLISQALSKTAGNKNQASQLLNMNRTTLIEKMKKKGLEFHPH